MIEKKEKAKVLTVGEDYYMRTHKCSLAEARKALAALEKKRLEQCYENAKAVPAVKWY